MNTHELYMQKCFDLALKGAGNVAPNPMVGSIIVFENRIIGSGYHEKYGEAHAEVNAIKSVRKEDLGLLEKSTIYVSLEPCFHFGKTPPCVNLILKNKIPKVVISVTDSNPKVGGKSIEKLRSAGVEVIIDVLNLEGKELIKEFLSRFSINDN